MTATKAKAPTAMDRQAWASIRTTISNMDNTVMTLMTWATFVTFFALGGIYSKEGLASSGKEMPVYLLIGALFFICVRVYRYSRALRAAIDSAMKLEKEFFTDPDNDPRALTHTLYNMFIIVDDTPLPLLGYMAWSIALLGTVIYFSFVF